MPFKFGISKASTQIKYMLKPNTTFSTLYMILFDKENECLVKDITKKKNIKKYLAKMQKNICNSGSKERSFYTLSFIVYARF